MLCHRCCYCLYSYECSLYQLDSLSSSSNLTTVGGGRDAREGGNGFKVTYITGIISVTNFVSDWKFKVCVISYPNVKA